jgi:hypothetical protein
MHRRATRILPWMDVFPVFLCHDTFLLCSLANVRFWNVAFRKDRRHRSAIHHHGNPALIDDLRAQHMVDKGETRQPVHVPTCLKFVRSNDVEFWMSERLKPSHFKNDAGTIVLF